MPATAALRSALLGTLAVFTGTASLAADSGTDATHSATTMYRWVDAQGVVHYSDTPQPGAAQIKVHGAQGFAAPAVPAGAVNAASAASAQDAAVYQRCAIAQPTAEQSLFAPASVQVVVQVSPALRDGDQLIVTYDGVPLPGSPTALTYAIDQPDRGAHSLNASIQDQSGMTLCTAAAVTFYIQRPSLLSPLAPARGH